MSKSMAKENIPRPYNRYNIFFMLEREHLILSKGGSSNWSMLEDGGAIYSTQRNVGYENIDLPPLPPRFAHLQVPSGWYIPGKQKKRRVHRKTHGVASFHEMAQNIAATWKTIDSETRIWSTAVERLLKLRYLELKNVTRRVQFKTSGTNNSKQAKPIGKVHAGKAPSPVSISYTGDEAASENGVRDLLATTKEAVEGFINDSLPGEETGGTIFWDLIKDAEMFGEVDLEANDMFAAMVASLVIHDARGDQSTPLKSTNRDIRSACQNDGSMTAAPLWAMIE